jgi:hypothetical protein
MPLNPGEVLKKKLPGIVFKRLAGCSAMLRVFTKKNCKKNLQKKFAKKHFLITFRTKISK